MEIPTLVNKVRAFRISTNFLLFPLLLPFGSCFPMIQDSTPQWATGPIALPCKNSRFCSSRIWQQVLYCFSCKNARFNKRTSLFTLSNSSSSSSISFLPEENRWRQDLPDQVSNCNNSILCAFMQMIYIFSESSFHPLSSEVKIILMRVDGKTRIFCVITY